MRGQKKKNSFKLEASRKKYIGEEKQFPCRNNEIEFVQGKRMHN